ncbi:MAG: type II toxin-antitoxin system prevent-host-death family antitoxin [Thermodesulfobacteriota bacterium]|nr:type II toxin-antitoxin system prevent-host-death family antitoxin [Thermodesulfobacteriota bacterium]
MQVNIHEAKTRFSKLIIQASKGEEIIIAKAGKPEGLLGVKSFPLTIGAADHLIYQIVSSSLVHAPT